MMNTQLALSFLVTGLASLAINVPLLQGKVKRNFFYGFRSAKSLESDENWFKINSYGARQMMIWAAIMVALGMGTFLLPFKTNIHGLIWFSAIVLSSVLVLIFQVNRYSKRL